jgi:short subunit dehydrogenase-like uncharacterized protein
MTPPFLPYGSYGNTCSLVADLAVRQGMRPILSGRDAVRLNAQVDTLGLECRPISLDSHGLMELTINEVLLYSRESMLRGNKIVDL